MKKAAARSLFLILDEKCKIEGDFLEYENFGGGRHCCL